MIRFVDTSSSYWFDDDPDNVPCCLFVDTATGRCVDGAKGGHMFFDLASVEAIPVRGARCAGLVPDGFFTPTGPVATS